MGLTAKASLGLGSGLFIALGVIIGGTLTVIFGKDYPTMKKGDSIRLIITLVTTATLCLWLMWICAYMAQMNPMYNPVHKSEA